MNGDPYKILGVSPSASDEEIKKAYRALVKKYHPDLHPGDEAAAEKMSEVNAAYEYIKSLSSERGGYSAEGGTSYTYADPDDIMGSVFSSFAREGFGKVSDRELYVMLEGFVESGMYREAARTLDAIRERDCRWYYFAARVCMGAGKPEDALRYAECAVNMAPDEQKYAQLRDEIAGKQETDLVGFIFTSVVSLFKKIMSEKYAGVRFAVLAYLAVMGVSALIFIIFIARLWGILGM